MTLTLNVWKEVQRRFRMSEVRHEASQYIGSLAPKERVVVAMMTTDRRWIPELVSLFGPGETRTLEQWMQKHADLITGSSALPSTFKCWYGIGIIPPACDLKDPKHLTDAPPHLKGLYEILAGAEVGTDE
jgi:hypothetical protein